MTCSFPLSRHVRVSRGVDAELRRAAAPSPICGEADLRAEPPASSAGEFFTKEHSPAVWSEATN